jgi:CDP-paratose 2-epimerase
MRLLVTGGCGFIGSNLAERALREGFEVAVFDNLQRVGSSANLSWLGGAGLKDFFHGDIRSSYDVERLIAAFRPEAVFHLAGQVAMTTSIEDPRRDFEVNALGTLNVLEAVRRCVPESPVLYSSTNKVYGDLSRYPFVEGATRYECPDRPHGFDEETPLEFHSPYGCSKGAADQYMLDYARIYGLRTVVFRHSSMYGPRQSGTFDQGWIAWFCGQATAQAENPDAPEFTIAGTGKQVRDVLHADDVTDLYFMTLDRIGEAAGKVFNVGGGMANSLSLLELFAFLEERLGVRLRYRATPWRTSDQRVFVADIRRITAATGWYPKIGFREGIGKMACRPSVNF